MILEDLAEHLHGKLVNVTIRGDNSTFGFIHGTFKNIGSLFFLIQNESDCFLFWKDVLKIYAIKEDKK